MITNTISTMFNNTLYCMFQLRNQQLQDYWNSSMYLKKRYDGYNEVCTNIEFGDFFRCGNNPQIGIVTAKITHIQCEVTKPKPSPQGPKGNYISYDITGDIGGHWRHPDHDHFTEHKYFNWCPTIENLLYRGFRKEARELYKIMKDNNAKSRS